MIYNIYILINIFILFLYFKNQLTFTIDMPVYDYLLYIIIYGTTQVPSVLKSENTIFITHVQTTQHLYEQQNAPRAFLMGYISKFTCF